MGLGQIEPFNILGEHAGGWENNWQRSCYPQGAPSSPGGGRERKKINIPGGSKGKNKAGRRQGWEGYLKMGGQGRPL